MEQIIALLKETSMLNLVGFAAIAYFVIQNQRKMRREFAEMKGKQSQDRKKNDVLDKDKEFERVGWLYDNIRALKDRINKKIAENRSERYGDKYNLEFVPMMRLSAVLKEYKQEVYEKLESLSDLAIHDENLQKELVYLDTWCGRCGLNLQENSSQLFQFALKRFRIAHPHIETTVNAERVFSEIFSEFDPLHTLGGARFTEYAEIVSKLSDQFVHSLLKRKLKPLEASILLSLMPGARVAIHLDMIPKRRLKLIVKNLSSMVKVLNPTNVQEVLAKIDSLYSPIYGGSRPQDIKTFFNNVVQNMSSESSKELINSLKREKISAKVLPNDIHRPAVAMLNAAPSEAPPAQPLSISDHPIHHARPSQEEKLPDKHDAKSVFIQFAEHSNPDNVDIKPK